MRRLAALAVAVLVVLPACGGDEAEAGMGDPGPALEQFYVALGRGQYRQVYEMLVTEQQERVTPASYDDCMSGVATFTVADFQVVDRTDEMVDVPGVDEQRVAVALTFEATVSGEPYTDTVRMVADREEWRVFLTAAALEECSA